MADQVHDAVVTRAKSLGSLTAGQWAQAGLVAARHSTDRADRAALLDVIGVTEALGLPLPVAATVRRYAHSNKIRPAEAPPP
jgi:hypothetical protein